MPTSLTHSLLVVDGTAGRAVVRSRGRFPEESIHLTVQRTEIVQIVVFVGERACQVIISPRSVGHRPVDALRGLVRQKACN